MVQLTGAAQQINRTPEIVAARQRELQGRIQDLEKVVVENERKKSAAETGQPVSFGKPDTRRAGPKSKNLPIRIPQLAEIITLPARALAQLDPTGIARVGSKVVEGIIKNPEVAGAILEAGFESIPDFIPGIEQLKSTVQNTVTLIQKLQATQEALSQTANEVFAGIKAQVTIGGDDADFSDIGSFIRDSFRVNQTKNLLGRKQRQAALKEFVSNSLEIAKGLVP